MQCSYCSNPIELERVNKELSTEMWCSVMKQAGEMGILQVHLSGGEPTARKDLEDIVSAASEAGLYSNLITAAVTLNRARLEDLAKRGLDHVQISFQDVDAENAERIGAYPGAFGAQALIAGTFAAFSRGTPRSTACLGTERWPGATSPARASAGRCAGHALPRRPSRATSR